MKGSSLTTFLMFLPLIAIPLLAIFGIPEFAPVNASLTSPQDAVIVNGRGTTTPSGSSKAESDFAPYPNRQTEAGPNSMTSDPFLFPEDKKAAAHPNANRLGEWAVAPKHAREDSQLKSAEKLGIIENRKRQSLDELDKFADPKLNPGNAELSSGQFAVPSGADTTPELTWSIAMQRLKKLGITDYVLQPGSQTQHCHFSCLYRSPNNPRITRRFEAEGSSPLQAASHVLTQLESRQ